MSKEEQIKKRLLNADSNVVRDIGFPKIAERMADTYSENCKLRRENAELSLEKQMKRLADAIGCACEIEGMKALNKEREGNDYSPGYSEVNFYNVMDKWGVKPDE